MSESQRTIILETSRLALRKMTADDISFIAEMFTDTETTRFYGRTFAHADAEDWLQRIFDRYQRDGYAFWLE